MALYSYKKKLPKKPRKVVSAISYGAIILGSLFLFWSFYPVVSFEVYSRFIAVSNGWNPVGSEKSSSLQKAGAILGNNNIFSTNLADYTQVGIWFPSVSAKETISLDIKTYSLSIPKLGIKDAKVIVGGEDLKKGLVHYLPRSVPGGLGNVTIIGHSTLPQFYNVLDYKTIFTYLPKLVSGDKAIINYNGQEYQYQVYDTAVITPEEVNVLDQDYNGSYLTLITCCPPGTYWKRCIAKAKLVKD